MLKKLSVEPLKLRAESALKKIRSIAAARGVEFLQPPNGGPWEVTTSRRQVLVCLESGEILGEPILDDHKNWKVTLHRSTAGVAIEVEAVLIGMNHDARVIVTSVTKRP